MQNLALESISNPHMSGLGQTDYDLMNLVRAARAFEMALADLIRIHPALKLPDMHQPGSLQKAAVGADAVSLVLGGVQDRTGWNLWRLRGGLYRLSRALKAAIATNEGIPFRSVFHNVYAGVQSTFEGKSPHFIRGLMRYAPSWATQRIISKTTRGAMAGVRDLRKGIRKIKAGMTEVVKVVERAPEVLKEVRRGIFEIGKALIGRRPRKPRREPVRPPAEAPTIPAYIPTTTARRIPGMPTPWRTWYTPLSVEYVPRPPRWSGWRRY